MTLAALLDALADNYDEAAERLPWRQAAACKNKPTEWFFPAKGVNPARAKAVCMTCPVRIECLDWAVEMRERQGVFGGTSEKQRRPLIKAMLAGTPLAEQALPGVDYGCGCDDCRAEGERILQLLAGAA